MRSPTLLLLAAALAAAPISAPAPTLEIKVDQVGYPVTAAKIALVSSVAPAPRFTVNLAKDGSVAYRGSLSESLEDPDSGDRVQAADFTRLMKPGTYYLDVPEVGRSWEFEIGTNVYAHAWRLAMRSYYGQRCGIAVNLAPDFPGYRHDACHLEGAYHPSSGKTGPHVSKGGWHDAGDYGRYVVNSGISTGTLLWAYELFGPRLKSFGLDLPESGNGAPDMLNEIRWNLEWMLSMQDDDGGVWHKQTSERFCDFIMPDKDKLLSLVIGTGKEPFKSTCAAGDFAAVMAIAGRVYQPYNPAFGNRCLRAARSAWAWMEQHPNTTFRNPTGVVTGEYGDGNCADEHLWAAAELFRSTGEAPFQHYFLDHYTEFRKSIRAAEPHSWANVGPLALWTFALAKGGDPTAGNAVRHDSIGAADEIVLRTASNGYRISLTPRDFVWGSNAVAANYAMQLLVTDALVHNPRYREAALENLHYLLGRNPFSLSYVTRVGANSVLHPHHRPSGADANALPWPGLLAGGPNHGRQDAAMLKLSPDLPPARMYVDDQEAYACNEVAINWNAPLVFVLAAMLEAK